MPYLLFLKKQRNLKLLYAAKSRLRFTETTTVLDQNHLTLIVFLKEFLVKKLILKKKSADDIKSMKNYPACKDLVMKMNHWTGTTLCRLGNFSCFLSSADFFKIIFFEKLFQEYIINLDPDQARHFVGPDLGPNCLQ